MLNKTKGYKGMGKLSKEEAARYAGAQWALEMVKAKGAAEAEAELKRRGVMFCPIGVKESDLDKFVNYCKANTVRTVLALSALTLRDEFEFGAQRVKRYIDRFYNKVECMEQGLTNWDDTLQILNDEIGIELEVPECCKLEV